MRIVLTGAVESTLTALNSLLEAGHVPVAVVTLPLAKAARHSDFVDLRPMAAGAGIPVIEAANSNAPEVLAQIRSFDPDFVFVIGWSQICRREFLEVPKYGCIGYHPALLPENRGRAVIAWTILQGPAVTGGSLFWLAEGVDAGDILIQRRFPLAKDETARSLMDKHLELLPQVLREGLELLAAGNCRRTPQDESEATYCARRTAEDGWIEWTQPAQQVWALIRAAGRPYPGAFTAHNGQKLTIWSAELVNGRPYWGLPGQIQEITPQGVLVQCGDREHVLLKQIQFENRSEMAAAQADLKMHSKLGAGPAAVLATAAGGGQA
jgi:methionyl-tRNA formyltransferase